LNFYSCEACYLYGWSIELVLPNQFSIYDDEPFHDNYMRMLVRARSKSRLRKYSLSTSKEKEKKCFGTTSSTLVLYPLLWYYFIPGSTLTKSKISLDFVCDDSMRYVFWKFIILDISFDFLLLAAIVLALIQVIAALYFSLILGNWLLLRIGLFAL